MRLLFAAPLLGALCTAAPAATLYENPWTETSTFMLWSSGGLFRSDGTGWQVYDSFTLAEDSRIEGLEFLASGVPGTATFAVFDAARAVELHRGQASFVSSSLFREDISGNADGIHALYDAGGLVLPAGTYWLAASLSVWSGRTAGNDLTMIQERRSPGIETYVRSEDMFFRLTGDSADAPVPLPAALPALLLALGGLAWRARARRPG